MKRLTLCALIVIILCAFFAGCILPKFTLQVDFGGIPNEEPIEEDIE